MDTKAGLCVSDARSEFSRASRFESTLHLPVGLVLLLVVCMRVRNGDDFLACFLARHKHTHNLMAKSATGCGGAQQSFLLLVCVCVRRST